MVVEMAWRTLLTLMIIVLRRSRWFMSMLLL
jgi:hypothetical protein